MRIEWLESAIFDLQRLKDFILPHNKEAAQRAFRIIRTAVAPLEANPRIGKPVEGLPDAHDLIIPFGASGYVLRYHIQGDAIFIIAVKHCKEAGFSDQTPSLWVVKDPVEAAYGMLADGGPSLAEELLKERHKDCQKE
jgi:plasmid stabilization system protein ParE